MLSSITPLGQRGRRTAWRRMVVAFWVGAIVAGLLTYGGIGLIGELTGLDGLHPAFALISIAVAAILDGLGVRAPGPRRQVSEDWLGRYRDWVTGLGFGFQLGTGLLTIVPIWGVWAMVASSVVLGLPEAATIGICLALGRSVMLVATRDVDRPESLGRLMARVGTLERPAHNAILVAYGLVIPLGVVLGF